MVASEATKKALTVQTVRAFFMQNCDKPFKTYDELIERMRDKNIIVGNTDFAKQALSNCSYYNLVNRYQDLLQSKQDPEKFVQGITFEQLYTLYTLDMSISNVLLKYILYIERSLKSKLSYVVSESFGECVNAVVNTGNSNNPSRIILTGYLDQNNYSNSHNKRNSILKSLYAVISYAKNPIAYKNKYNKKEYISQSLSHYVKSHNHIPPWILMTSLVFGQVENWYSILKPSEKTKIVNSFIKCNNLNIDEKKEYLKKSFSLLRDFRNSIAHGNQITKPYNNLIPKKQIVALSRDLLTEDEYKRSASAKSGIHALVCVLISLLNDEYLEYSFIQDLFALFIEYEEKNILINSKKVWCQFGLPDDFIQRIIVKYNLYNE